MKLNSIAWWEIYLSYFNVALKQSEFRTTKPYNINNINLKQHLNVGLDVFDNYMQQDAHEFLNYLLNTIGDLLQGIVSIVCALYINLFSLKKYAYEREQFIICRIVNTNPNSHLLKRFEVVIYNWELGHGKQSANQRTPQHFRFTIQQNVWLQ